MATKLSNTLVKESTCVATITDTTNYGSDGYTTSANFLTKSYNPLNSVLIDMFVLNMCDGARSVISKGVRDVEEHNSVAVVSDIILPINRDGYISHYQMMFPTLQELIDNWSDASTFTKVYADVEGVIHIVDANSTVDNIISEEFNLVEYLNTKPSVVFEAFTATATVTTFTSLCMIKKCRYYLIIAIIDLMRKMNCSGECLRTNKRLKSLNDELDYINLSITAIEYMIELGMDCEAMMYIQDLTECNTICQDILESEDCNCSK